MLDYTSLLPSQSNQEEFASLTRQSDNDDEPMDDWNGDDSSDAEYFPSEDQIDDEETETQIVILGIRTLAEARSENSNGHDSVELEEMNTMQKLKTLGSGTDVGPKSKKKRSFIIPDGPNRFKYKGLSFQQNEEDETYTCDTCGFKTLPNKMVSIRRHLHHHLPKPSIENGMQKRPKPQKAVVPDGPNTFKYNGHGLKLNDEDQCYSCGACDFKGTTNMHSVLIHIRQLHYTEEDKLQYTAVKTSDTKWIYGGKYKIIRVGEKHTCVSCGLVKSQMNDMIAHIRTQHVDMEGPEEVVPFRVTDTPPINDSTPTEGVYQSVPYTFNPLNNKYTCGICQAEISASRRNLGRHIKERHTDAALKVICEICGKGLVHQEAYRKHLKKHQTEPKSCPTCDKKFRDDRSFKRHLKVHASFKR